MSETVREQAQGRPRMIDDADAVAEIAALIFTGADDDRLRWTPDRLSCRLVTDIVAPEALRQRCEERLRRFNDELRDAMAGSGWIVSGGWWRRPKPVA